MTHAEDHAFYEQIASWWPLISPLEDYREEGAYVLSLLEDIEAAAGGRPSLLDLGSGGGHLAHFLAERFDPTLVDRSAAMLDVSRGLHESAEHVCEDMRSVRLQRRFDVVVAHDAIEYMTTEEDLRAALRTVAVHLRPGGRAVVIPDATREIFEPSHDCGGSDGVDGRSVRYLEWTTDPDPHDTVVRTDYVFALRDAEGRVQTVHDVHETGLFSRATWLRLFGEVGLAVVHVIETTEDDRQPRDVFIATHV
jgi:SAM-dependent methyltransferase